MYPARHTTLSIFLFAALVGPASVAAEEEPPEHALIAAFLSMPAQARQHAVALLRGEADTTVAPYMDNPILQYRHEQGIGPGDGFVTAVIGGELRFDVAGKHDLRVEAGRAHAERHRHEVRAQLLEDVCGLRARVLDLERLDAQLTIRERFEVRHQWIVETVTALADGQEKSAYDVERARWRLGLHEEETAKLRGRRASLATTLSTHIDRSIPEGIRSTLPEDLSPLEDLLARGLTDHPDLEAARVLEQGSAADAKLAERAWIPDLGVYGAYRLDAPRLGSAPMHGYELGLSMALPVFRKGEGARADARARVAGARLEGLRLREAIRVRITAAHDRARATQTLSTDIATRWPARGQEAWDRAVAAYREGVLVLGELEEMVEAEESRALDRVRIRHAGRVATLEAWCAAGFFPENAINEKLSGAVQ